MNSFTFLLRLLCFDHKTSAQLQIVAYFLIPGDSAGCAAACLCSFIPLEDALGTKGTITPGTLGFFT